MKKHHKVDDHDYKLLQEAKKKAEEAGSANNEYQKEFSRKHVEMMITQLERQKAFQESEIKEGVSRQKHESFVDGRKPIFIVQNDLEKTEFDLWNYRRQLQEMDKLG